MSVILKIYNQCLNAIQNIAEHIKEQIVYRKTETQNHFTSHFKSITLTNENQVKLYTKTSFR